MLDFLNNKKLNKKVTFKLSAVKISVLLNYGDELIPPKNIALDIH